MADIAATWCQRKSQGAAEVAVSELYFPGIGRTHGILTGLQGIAYCCGAGWGRKHIYAKLWVLHAAS